MGDEVQGGPAAGGEETQVTATPNQPTESPRAAKIAAFRATVGSALAAAASAPPSADPAAAPAKPTPPAVAKPADKPADPAAPADAKKPDETPPDEQTARGLELLDKRDKRYREQLAAEKATAKAELDAERAELARMRAELGGKTSSFDDIKKLPIAQRAMAALKAVGIETEDDHEVVSRQTYALSKSGKADPKNKAYADQVAEKQGVASEIEAMKRELADTKKMLTERDQRSQLEQIQGRYLDDAVKAFPADPSFIGLAHTANPGKARASILALGQRMELEAMEADGGQYDPSHTPTHAQVIARYEADKRQQLKDDGFTDDQIAGMLKPGGAASAPATRTPPKTLDVTARPTTPTNPGTLTRDEKIAKARIGAQQRQAGQ